MLGQAVRAAAQLPSKAATGATSTRVHSRQAQRHAERDRLQAIRRDTTRRQRRELNGRFAPALALPSHPCVHSSMDSRPGQSSHPQTDAGSATDATATEIYDYGAIPVGEPDQAGAPVPSLGAWDQASLDLPPIEDTESIQLALIEVLQALAANQLDTKPFSQRVWASKSY